MFTNDERRQLKDAVKAAIEGNPTTLSRLTKTFTTTHTDAQDTSVLGMFNVMAASSLLMNADEYQKLRDQFAQFIAMFETMTPPDQNSYYLFVINDILMCVTNDINAGLGYYIEQANKILETHRQMMMAARQMSMANDPRALDTMKITQAKTEEYSDLNNKKLVAQGTHLCGILNMCRLMMEERDKEQGDHNLFFEINASLAFTAGCLGAGLVAEVMKNKQGNDFMASAILNAQEAKAWNDLRNSIECASKARSYWFKHPDEKKELDARIKELTVTKANLEEKMKAPQEVIDQENILIKRLERERDKKIQDAADQVDYYQTELLNTGMFQRKRKKELNAAIEKSTAEHEAIKKSATEEYEREAAPHLEKKVQAEQELASLRAQFNPVNNTLKELQDKLWNVKE